MSLFQSSVLQKYINALDTALVDAAYAQFTAHFHDSGIQENIRNAKEEQYQGEFLIDLFVKVLGYVKNPSPGFNLTTELKNVKDSKKADGAIIDGDKVLAVIELKGTAVTDLGRIEVQAFGYKNNQPGCVFVITSNFEKLRFYIDNAVDFEEFNLFTLTRERFDVLWLCLSAETLLRLQPKQLKDESLSRDEVVTKELYKDYSLFRTEVYRNIVANNTQYDKLTLFKETQKLLDRFLFIFFAEDRQLLPPNSILAIVQQWKDLRDKYDEYQPLYERFKKYFGYLNTGYKGQKHDIFAYNGGLFRADPILDSITIDDDLLHKHTVKLSNYDFVSEVSVNILGHIFEHSLNEIEEIQAEIEGTATEKATSKRKKDGVFYTPKYITKYIVDNTVGKLCEEKKTALGIDEADYDRGRKNRQKETVKKLDKNLKDYRIWLLQLTICDPACGSGAFLNQALEFLIAEHGYVDELYAKLHGDAISLFEVENSILENNLFGVDINEESVEIAKLSLWLRTAQKGRKLTSLNNNIKCGNSLIDDPAVAGEKAFDWEKEFPQVFEKGGFDVVIGNPPYGALLSESDKVFIEKRYRTFEYQVNTYVLFYETGINLLKEKGYLGYITPATFTYQHYFQKLRTFLQEFNHIAISKYFYEVFEDADIGDSVTWVIQKAKNKKKDILIQICKTQEDSNIPPVLEKYTSIINISDNSYTLSELKLDINKYYFDSELLDSISNIIVGIKPYQSGKGYPKQTKQTVKEKIFTSNNKVDETFIKCVIGKDFNRYGFVQEPKMYLSYGKWLAEPRDSAPFFDNEKIILRQTSDSLIGHIDDQRWVNLNNVYNIGKTTNSYELKYLLAILNSKFMNLIYQNISQEKGRTFAEVKKINLSKLPIKKIDLEEQQPFISKVNKIIELKSLSYSIINQFSDYLTSKFSIEKLTNKLQSWHTLSFGEFLKELKKAKVSLSLSEEAEWMGYFNEQKAKAQTLQQEIDRVDREIDGMVYGLYGLDEAEIAIVEGS